MCTEKLSTQKGKNIYIRLALLWGLFFVSCFSLGYPTLNRYKPSESPVTDSRFYAELVEKDFASVEESTWRFRILVPYVAKPFYWLGKGNIGSWDPAFFALLVANSIFSSLTALVLLIIGLQEMGDFRPGLLASLLFLVHFNVSNLYLAGLVDSAEVFLMVVLAWAMLNGAWNVLPLLGVVGGVAKETFIPFSGVFALGWYLSEGWPPRIRVGPAVNIVVMVLLGLAVLTVLRSLVAADIVWPWHVALGLKVERESWVADFFAIFANRHFYYTFVWLLPLGLLGLRHVPREWIWASALAFAAACFMSVWADAGSNIGRPLFSAAGPMLVFASAAFLWNFLGGQTSQASSWKHRG